MSVDVAELVAAEVALCRDRGAQRGVRLLADSGSGTTTCIADPDRLRRALRELLQNALAFAPDRSTVGITTTRNVTGVCLAVSDQGPGIGPGQRARMVRPFERGTHPVQPVAGRGMGLALASAVAASHRGRLVLSESVGGGLRASLELPADFRGLPDTAAF
jgi:signal transduction histidine kinase